MVTKVNTVAGEFCKFLASEIALPFKNDAKFHSDLFAALYKIGFFGPVCEEIVELVAISLRQHQNFSIQELADKLRQAVVGGHFNNLAKSKRDIEIPTKLSSIKDAALLLSLMLEQGCTELKDSKDQIWIKENLVNQLFDLNTKPSHVPNRSR